MAYPERLSIVIAADKEKVGIRNLMQEKIEATGQFSVLKLSRLKISRIAQEIKPQHPDIILVAASLYYPHEFKECTTFIRKLRRHLPESTVISQTPHLTYEQLNAMFEAGAHAWIDERLEYEFLGKALLGIVTNQEISSNMIRKNPSST